MNVIREAIFKKLLSEINKCQKGKPLLVAIDGVDGSGKSFFTKDLSLFLKSNGLNTLNSSVDYFHNPRVVRHSSEMRTYQAYFKNSFDYSALKKELLDPIKKATRDYCLLEYFNHITDLRVDAKPVTIASDTVLVFEGIFSHRDELKDYWDFSIFLDVSFDESYKRMAVRDGCPSDPQDQSNERYYQGQKLYFEKCEPKKRADIVIDNNDYKNPKILEIIK